MQRKPRFNGVLLALVLVAVLVVVTAFTSGFSGETNSMSYSKVVSYFENQQVTAFNLDLNNSTIELCLKEGKVELPKESKPLNETVSSFSDAETAGLLGLGGGEQVLEPNGGSYVVKYKLPYIYYFLDDMRQYIDAYNEANPDAPMVYDMQAVRTSIPWMEIMMYVVILGSMGFVFFSMYRGGAGGGGVMNVGRAKVKDQQEGQRKATFADVAGADEEKAELEEVVQFLRNPGQFNSLGARIPHGVLLVGPPGTGKTLLARACAGEAGVPFYSISGSDFVEMYVGVGASRVRDLFEKAKKSMPSIIFIDEIDAVGRQRGAGLGGGHDRGTGPAVYGAENR